VSTCAEVLLIEKANWFCRLEDRGSGDTMPSPVSSLVEVAGKV
jgi:hypothetical protein